MGRVEKAIEAGRCSIAVGGALLRDPEVMLALTRRAALTPMALAGPTVAPLVAVSPEGVARAIAQPGGILVLVEPENVDATGVKTLGELLQRARHRPDVVVVSRSWNPFAFGQALAGLRVAHEKGKGKAFIETLPEPPADEAGVDASDAIAKVAKAGTEIPAPRFTFVGRDEEVEALTGLLAQGGPLVLSGPPGVGRTLVLEHAAKRSGLQRLPDFWLGWGSGADQLTARIAAIGQEVGDARLADLVKGPHSAADVARVAVEVLSNEALKGKLFVVHELEIGLGRDHDFFRRSRLELLLVALLTGTAALPVVFVSTRHPTFHREGEGANLRKLEIGGVKGRFLHEIFEACKAVEFPREKFGPISERIHGHCLAAKTFAIATRVRQDGAELPDEPKFLAMETVADTTPISKQLAKRIEKLPEALRTVLARLAHLRIPVDGSMLTNELGVSRTARLELLAQGLLEIVGTEEEKRFRVHPMVRRELGWREITDFDVSARLADLFAELAKKATGLHKLQLEQEQSRFAAAARKPQLRPKLDLPDHDMALESVEALIRSKQPKLDLAEQRLNEILKQDPTNADAWLFRLELATHADEARTEGIEALLDEAMTANPVPELVQQAVSFLLSRRQRPRAIVVLEKGLAVFPDESRLHTRLAAVLLRQGRRNEAVDHLKRAMELEPMLPDSYGLLGMAKRDGGREAVGEAEGLLREAVRLAPDDPVQVSRLVDLLLERARVEVDQQKALREEAKKLLDDAVKGDRRAPEACLLYATLLREEGGDLERAAWFLAQARKATDRGHERSRRIVVERALVDMAKGELDGAENALRQHIGKDPSHARAFAALGHVLEAREQFIPAHAEYLRAKERAAQNGLEIVFYDQQLARVQAIIEAQAAGLYSRPEEREPAPSPSVPSTRILRRRAQHEATPDEAPTEPDAEPAEAPPDAPADEVPESAEERTPLPNVESIGDEI